MLEDLMIIKTPLHNSKSIEIAEILLNAGADVDAVAYFEQFTYETPVQYNENVETALNLLKRERGFSSCENISGYSKLQHTQYGQRISCMAEVSCTFDIGLAPNSTQITRTYQAVCSALPNGECPPEIQCVSDLSVVEADEVAEEGHQSFANPSLSESFGIQKLSL